MLLYCWNGVYMGLSGSGWDVLGLAGRQSHVGPVLYSLSPLSKGKGAVQGQQSSRQANWEIVSSTWFLHTGQGMRSGEITYHKAAMAWFWGFRVYSDNSLVQYIRMPLLKWSWHPRTVMVIHKTYVMFAIVKGSVEGCVFPLWQICWREELVTVISLASWNTPTTLLEKDYHSVADDVWHVSVMRCWLLVINAWFSTVQPQYGQDVFPMRDVVELKEIRVSEPKQTLICQVSIVLTEGVPSWIFHRITDACVT